MNVFWLLSHLLFLLFGLVDFVLNHLQVVIVITLSL